VLGSDVQDLLALSLMAWMSMNEKLPLFDLLQFHKGHMIFIFCLIELGSSFGSDVLAVKTLMDGKWPRASW
jgi:hypothetical protein